MKYRRLDSNGDYVFGQGNQDFLYDSEAVAQACVTRLKLLLGEWWEDLSSGFPLWQEILGKSGSESHIKAINDLIRRRILNTTGVKEIISFESSFNSTTRKFYYQTEINTDYTTIELQGEL